MTTIPNKKHLVVILPIVAVAAIVAYLTIGSSHEVQAITGSTVTVTKETLDVETHDSFFAKGGRSAITMDPVVNEIRLVRGVPTTVDLDVKHIAGTNPFPTVTVKALPPTGYIWYSPTLASSTTPEQRTQAAETGKLIPGSIDLGTLVTFSNNSADVQAGGEGVIHMTITLPKSIPDDMIGQGVYLPVLAQVVDSEGNSNTVFADIHGVNIVVGG